MSIPKQPRQQMINLMYLVLTALLALNVSSEVLNAFKLINDKLRVSNDAVEVKSASLMSRFEQKFNSNAAKTKPFYDDAKTVRSMVGEFYEYTEELKSKLIEESGGMEGKKMVGLKNTDVPTRIMIAQKTGWELEKKVQELREKLLSLPMLGRLEETERKELENQIALSIVYDQKEAEKLDKKSWASYNFERVPVIAAVTMLAKLQGDAKEAEARILEKLYNNVDVNSYIFEDLAARVITQDNLILANKQQFNASIFFAATSKTHDVQMFVGKFKNATGLFNEKGELQNQVDEFPLADGFTQLSVTDGMADFSELPTKPGDQKHDGVIKIRKPDGSGYNYFPFQLAYESTIPSIVVSPERLNLLYMGVENPVSVSVPGYPADRVRAYLDGKGTLSGTNGNYIAKVNEVGTTKVRVNVVMDDGKEVNMGEMTFRIKRTPDPVAEVAKQEGGRIETGRFKTATALYAVMKDFEFEMNFRVVNYRMTMDRKGELFEANSETSEFPQRMKDLVLRARPGDVYYFEEIFVIGPDNLRRKIQPITFRII